MMLAARLHGPGDLRLDKVPRPGPPLPGQVLLRVKANGICGSDLHTYTDARIGDTPVVGPLVLGHEFSAVIERVGPASRDGRGASLKPGMHVAVDPAQPCGQCELCRQGNTNLCRHLHFCGNYPDGGSLCQWMHMPASSCFPVPKSIDPIQAALLEPLGVAIHATDLARIRVGCSVAVLGAGPIGLLILQLVKLAGAQSVFATDKFSWRLNLASQFGGIPINCEEEDAVQRIQQATDGHGVDVTIEAAWGDYSVEQAGEMVRHGGCVVLVGIPSDDRLSMKHSTARRKGLTLLVSRRMKHTYHRAIRLVASGLVDVNSLVSHRFPLKRVKEAFALNAAYKDNVIKVIIES